MQKKIFYFIILATSTLAIFINIFLLFSIESVLRNELFDRLKHYANAIKTEVMEAATKNALADLKDLDKTYRISIVDEKGDVIYDNFANIAMLENHKNRIEIKEAHESGESKSMRYSDTFLERNLYYAQKISVQGQEFVLRIAKEQDYLYAMLMRFVPYIIGEIIMVFIFCFLLAKYLTHIILKPILTINLKHLDKDFPYPELQALIEVFKKQNKTIKNQFKHLKQKKQELQSLTQGMHDGLIFINRAGRILSVNTSAEKYFSNLTKKTHILQIQNDAFLKPLLQHLRDFKKGKIKREIREQILFMDNRLVECEVVFSPIFSQKAKFKGLIIVICDITEFKRIQNLSKEFSANVTHELKTPLTSILGNVEMIKNNLVTSSDLPHFIDTIYSESKRLLHLIEDILRLSFLDESHLKNLPFVRVNLQNLVLQTSAHLKEVAEKYGVMLNTQLDACYIFGVQELLENAIFNLCDNAIKYNHKGGYVNITLKNLQDSVELSIKDNGIGIPKDLQGRVFERFFCVDKSQSKKVGGTGLGLSIVKSALSLHHAKIILKSDKDVGTEFIITFLKHID